MNDTIVALATPHGESALSLIRVSGPDSSRLATALSGRAIPPRQAIHGDYHDRSGRLLDDVVYTFYRGPGSYSGEDALELSCHGSPFISERILEDLMARGCRGAEPGEFTRRAFLNGRLDLSQAEAVMDLIRARSERAVEAAHRQLRGALGREIVRLSNDLLEVVARIEATIDFPEEDLPPDDRRRSLEAVQRVAGEAGRLLATGRYGSLVRDGVRVVLAGEPNVGKSSLLNRLIGYDRALVSAGPGTTRDFIEERVLSGAHSIRYLDTAGLWAGGDEVDRAGMGKTLEQVADADILLLVLDAQRPFPTLPDPVVARVSKKPALVIWNKTDLCPAGSAPAGLAHVPNLAVSALRGTGLDPLRDEILALIETNRIEFGDEVIAISARHEHALRAMKECLDDAGEKLRMNEGLELIASDLRGSMDYLGQITGRIDNEAILDRIFASFCIGK